MAKQEKIRPIQIRSKQEPMALAIAKLIDRAKTIKGTAAKKRSDELFDQWFHERTNSIRKRNYLAQWKKFIQENEVKKPITKNTTTK